MPTEWPLAHHEMSFLLPHLLREGRGKLEMYFTRVYNPVWTNPDGFSWIEMLTRRVEGRRSTRALTPVWSETAWFADYVLPMGLGPERHDLMSQETHAGALDRLPPARAARGARARRAQAFEWTWQAHEAAGRRGVGGGRVLDRALVAHRPRRLARHPQVLRVAVPARREAPRSRSTTAGSSRTPCRACPRRRRRQGLTPLEYMRKYGAFLVEDDVYETPREAARREGPRRRRGRRGHARRVARAAARSGVEIDGVARAGFPTPSRKLEFFSQTMKEWGWPEQARARLHPEPRALVAARPRGGRDGAAADVPPADAHPHALGQREVALRDLAHQPGVDAPGGRAADRRPDRRPRRASRPRIGHFVDKRLGDGGHPAGRRRLLASPRALAARREHRRRALVDRAGRPPAGRAGHGGACGTIHGVRPFESDDPD